MAERNTFQECFSGGKEDEMAFIKHIKQTRPDLHIRESTTEEDMKSHIDGYITVNGKEYPYDYKGLRSIKRGGELRPDVQWLELDSGYKNGGSLYGEEHFIIFQQEGYHLLFRRADILYYLLPIVANQETLTMPNTENEIKVYQKYHRVNRTDCIVLVPTIDLIENLEHRKL